MTTTTWTRRDVLTGSMCAFLVGAACGGGETTWLETVDPTKVDEADPLSSDALQEILGRSEASVAYDARHGGTAGNHDEVVILAHGRIQVVARPKETGEGWTVPQFKLPHAESGGQYPELPAEYADLREPDFIAAGPSTAEIPDHRGNNPVVIARGSRLVLFSMVRSLGEPPYPGAMKKPIGQLYSVGVDLAPLVGPTRKDHRIVMEPDKGAVVHLVPWSDTGPDPSRPGVTLMISSIVFNHAILSIDTRRLM